ncbi:hypothetical protein BJX61DRAFT_539039 [Aspergillus egyptiacus]|nr:hypothetical protein BJX61DRAFT_539039 [Aspergillus egyptiacus]
MASQKVFTIVELLESILLLVDIQTLLTSAQRVSRHWHAVIQASPRLQARLFLSPASYPVYTDTDTDTDAATDTHTENPYLTRIWTHVFLPATSSSFSFRSENETADTSPGIEKPYLHPTATWRRMLIQQPPSQRIGLLEDGYWPAKQCLSFATISASASTSVSNNTNNNNDNNPNNDNDNPLRLTTLLTAIQHGILGAGMPPRLMWLVGEYTPMQACAASFAYLPLSFFGAGVPRAGWEVLVHLDPREVGVEEWWGVRPFGRGCSGWWMWWG